MHECPICGRSFPQDPVYDFIGAVARPSDVARQVIAYHTLRRDFEREGCEVVGVTHRR
jgi:hypothetical protein